MGGERPDWGQLWPTMPDLITADSLVAVFHLGFCMKSHWKNPFHIYENLEICFLEHGNSEIEKNHFTYHVRQKKNKVGVTT